jgi:predicted phosphohydrolase
MSIYAISDLHLSFNDPKPMDIFGPIWQDHAEKIAANWDAMVKQDDTVLIAGDHSWALRFEDAKQDLDYIAQRPGKKILIRGNHDYWWRREATNKMKTQVHESIYLMHGDTVLIDNTAITGTRGWRIEQEEDAGDTKVLNRELTYFERGLKQIPETAQKRIAMLHYPPFNVDLTPNAFADLLQAYKIDTLIYGHIHSGAYLEGNINGIEYKLVSADHTDMKPVLIS